MKTNQFKTNLSKALGNYLKNTNYIGDLMRNGIATMSNPKWEDFEKEFGEDFQVVYGKITSKHIEDGLLIKEGDNIRLTDLGLDVSNMVMSSYILC